MTSPVSLVFLEEAMSDNPSARSALPETPLKPGSLLVARLIGREFEPLVQRARGAAGPFDADFGKSMVKTASHLLTAGTGHFAYVEHLELSLALGDARRYLEPVPGEQAPDAVALALRIAAQASAKLSSLLGEAASFDASLYEFNDAPSAAAYFRWRQEQAIHQALDRYCEWVLRCSGADDNVVNRMREGLGVDEKVEILRQNKINYAEIPRWQQRGSGVYVSPERLRDGPRRLLVDTELPTGAAYNEYLVRLLVPSAQAAS
jgi:tRNA(His) 5'-end guanylyltransferase